MNHMYQEIYQQAEILRKIPALIKTTLENIVEEFKVKKPTQIVLAARGSSDNACNYFKYLAEVYLGIPVSFAAPSVLTLYDGMMDYSHAMVIGVSQSGQAQDVLAVMQMASVQGALVIAITNALNSPMAPSKNHHPYMGAGLEKSVAATKTFTSELFVLGLLVSEMTGKALSQRFLQIPDKLDEIKGLENKIFETAKTYVNVDESYVLARGYLYAIAQESALKIQETCYINAKAYSVSDFHHGPFAVLDEQSHVILFMNSGKTYKDTLDMAKKILLTKAHLIILTDLEIPEIECDAVIKMPQIDEILAPFTYIMAMQLFAMKLSLIKGNNPDVPRGLNKITITK
jgi:glutamine---fructose-6-phosphate transaminase (isomerizing)